MMRSLARLLRDRRGLGAVEFALACPILLLGIIGTAQLGTLYFANAGLTNAIAEGARLATIYPRPTNTQIQARITAKRFGLEPARMTTPVITSGTSDGANYLEISATYSVPLDFVFLQTRPVTLTKRRRVFVHSAV
jgi:Flp pilus assembly protein TadG